MFLLLARDKLIKSIEFLTNVYERNQTSQQTWPIFDAFICTLTKWLRIFFIAYAIGIVAVLYGPFIVSLTTYFMRYDQRLFLFPLMLPGTSLEIDVHYELNIIVQLFFGQISGSIFLLWDALLVIQFLHVILMANLVCNKIRTIEELIVAEEPSLPSDIAAGLKVVIELQIEYSDYVRIIQDLYKYPLAIIFAVALQSIGSKILLILKMKVTDG